MPEPESPAAASGEAVNPEGKSLGSDEGDGAILGQEPVDLDGTLVHTARDIAIALNQARAALALTGIDLERVPLVALPSAYRPDRFFRFLPSVRQQIARLIDEADYLAFSIGGLFGDWGSVAALEAHRKGRRFAVWTDRVESEGVRHEARAARTRKARLKASLYHRPMAALERAIIRRSTLGLFHGAETDATYAPYASKAEIVHDIHLREEGRIPPDALRNKLQGVMEGPLHICYLGRRSRSASSQEF